MEPWHSCHCEGWWTHRYLRTTLQVRIPTQVATLTLKFLIQTLKDTEKSAWSDVYFSYDNMCNLDRLKLLKSKLPLDGPLSDLWLDINKVIDPLHLPNHKRPECKELYNPDTLADTHPEANLMVCEQVFCWLGRYKKILNSMPKAHHHFFLHRLIKRRNSYTSYCQKVGKYPLLPAFCQSSEIKYKIVTLV